MFLNLKSPENTSLIQSYEEWLKVGLLLRDPVQKESSRDLILLECGYERLSFKMISNLFITDIILRLVDCPHTTTCHDQHSILLAEESVYKIQRE